MMRIILLTICFATSAACAMEAPSQESIKVMTYNVRRKGSEKLPEHLWDNRKKNLVQQLIDSHADIIGLQEPTKDQLEEIMNYLPAHYKIIGEGRTASWFGLGADEYNPIIYNSHRVNVESSGTIKLNEDPWWWFGWDKIKQIGLLPRICTWAHFNTATNNKPINVFNTHLDHKFIEARLNQIRAIMPHINEQNYPTILMGDFNNEWKDEFKCALNQLINTRDIAQQVNGPHETRTEFCDKKPVAIDHILVKNISKVITHTTIKEIDGIYASDHRPVIATITLQ